MMLYWSASEIPVCGLPPRHGAPPAPSAGRGPAPEMLLEVEILHSTLCSFRADPLVVGHFDVVPAKVWITPRRQRGPGSGEVCEGYGCELVSREREGSDCGQGSVLFFDLVLFCCCPLKSKFIECFRTISRQVQE